ncbi:type IV pilus assembly protein PilM [Aeromicrobium sp.]|nr:type IV pilus assembly protein PilM [Candidatus Saccharibacteria bacterium]
MGSTTKTNYFFKHKPLFGLDIGAGSLKVMQLDAETLGAKPTIIGYGTTHFDRTAIDNGEIVQPEVVAKAMVAMFKDGLVGDITTRRVAMALPAYRTFTRAISLSSLKPKELADAVQLEAEQYIPMPIEELYLDYSIIRSDKETTEVFAVAVPRKIVDSYLTLARILGLEAVLVETTLGGCSRLFSVDKQSAGASVIIDFGSQSSDISIFDKTILVTGTVQGGGAVFTSSIKSKLNVTQAEANIIKNKYGLSLSKKQKEIKDALTPTLDQIVKEIRRMIRYYDERYGADKPVTQVITLGGGANMPGLTEYMTEALRLPVRHCEPWQYFSYKKLQIPSTADKPMYATAAGLALINPKEVLKS